MNTKASVSSPVEITLFDLMDKQEEASPKRLQTKKERILRLYHEGKTDIFDLAEAVGSQPSYVGNVLVEAGLIQGYCDLYTTTSYDLNIYSRFFRNLLSFKTPDEARRCVEQLDSLYQYFERIGDRAGQHHAQMVALIGRNRARWSGKHEAARIFTEWLLNN